MEASQIMMALGDYRFALNTAAYQTLERETAWRWPTVDSIGQHPAPQFVGKGSDTIRLAGTIYPHFAGGLEQVDAIRAEADKGEPLRMVCGRGKPWGYWAITGLRETQRVFWSNGAPRAQEFELSLLFYALELPRARPTPIASLSGAEVAKLRIDETGAVVRG